jgi:glycerol-3-phosphate acyltransferase PlsY
MITIISLNLFYILLAYFVGTIPLLKALAKLKHVRLEGDYHACLIQKGGIGLGLTGILGELVKGVIPIFAGRLLGFDINVIAVAGVSTVCGQMWPVFQGFDGEKGNSIGLSMSAALAYQPLLIALIPIATGAGVRTVKRLLKRSKTLKNLVGGNYSYSLPLGMLIGFLVLPLASWYLDEPPGITLGFAALFVLLMVRRATAGLTHDLKENSNIILILKGRLLFDRGVSKYRS